MSDFIEEIREIITIRGEILSAEIRKTWEFNVEVGIGSVLSFSRIKISILKNPGVSHDCLDFIIASLGAISAKITKIVQGIWATKDLKEGFSHKQSS